MAKIILSDGNISSSAGINIPGSFSVSGNVTLGDNFTDILVVNSSATFNDDLTIQDTLSGTIAKFNVVTASFTGSGSGLYNLTASNILNFTSDVRKQFTAGTNVTIVDGVISSTGGGNGNGSTSPGGLDKAIQFNSGSTFSGSSNLIYDYTTNTISGTNAQFATITGSNLNITGTISGSSTQSIIKSDQGISFRTRDGGTGSFTERMFISTNDTINVYSSINATSLTASVITANVITSSVTLTGSTAQFTRITSSYTTTTQNITGASSITNGVMYFISAATAAYTITLPAAVAGGMLYLIRTDSTSYIITINGHINGVSNTNNTSWFPASTSDRRVVLVSNGTSWYPIVAATIT